ncbi:DUF2314 domain-containing protein [Nocardioides nanhaiensis]|uniref:DUF2314 domain-containing protein n=1 Tax=Nocardioides nanhaiensis TaxID=1476871 RepID=A0ABP8WRR0_9ACTN
MVRTARRRLVELPADDPWLSLVSRAARDHLDLLGQPSGARTRQQAAVKVPLSTGEGPGTSTEHVWLGEVELGEDVVRGVLLNRPVEPAGRGVDPGSRLVVPRARVEDWILGLDGVAVGGFTVQLSRLHLGRLARRRHDRAWGLVFPPPGLVRLRPGDEAGALVDLPLPGARSPW